MSQSDAPAIIDELCTSLCSHFPGCKYPCGISNPRPGLTPGTALRAVGSGITKHLGKQCVLGPSTAVVGHKTHCFPRSQ